MQSHTAVAFTPEAIKTYKVSNASRYAPYCHQPPASEAASTNITCMDIGNASKGG